MNDRALGAPGNIHDDLTLSNTATEPRVDSRDLAKQLGNRHQSVFELIGNYRADFEELGKVRFETGASPDSKTGQRMKYSLLNEDQCYLLLTYSRNTARVRQLKVRLVKAFREARRSADIRKTEYLPEYHRLHDAIHALAKDSNHERFAHMNVNKLVNRTVGIAANQRGNVSAPTQSLLSVVQTIAANAMQGAADHRDGYDRAKGALQGLAGCLALEA